MQWRSCTHVTMRFTLRIPLAVLVPLVVPFDDPAIDCCCDVSPAIFLGEKGLNLSFGIVGAGGEMAAVTVVAPPAVC